MFIRYGIKKVTYGLVILVAISSIEVRCSSYDYLKSTLPYAAVLAFIATNYYRRSVAQSPNAYDSLSYALPVVAAGAGSLLAQPDNWRGAFVRSLPAMIFALGAMGLERMKTPPSGNNPDETISKSMPATVVTNDLLQQPEPVSLRLQRDQEIENKAISSGESSTSMTRDLPIEPVSPSLDQKIVQIYQDQPPIGQKVETPEDLIRYFFEKKNELDKLFAQYNQQDLINQIGSLIEGIFVTNKKEYGDMLPHAYKKAERIYHIYNELQKLAAEIKQLTNDKEKRQLIDGQLEDAAKRMLSIVDPVQVVAIAAYTNALINLYIKLGKNEERPIIELMPEVLNIQDFFTKYGLSFGDDGNVTDLIAKIEPTVREKFELFKNFDQETSQRVDEFSNLTEKLNDYLKNNDKKEFKSNFNNINKYYNRMNEWFQKYTQEIHNMGARVKHVFQTNSINRYNTYENIIKMLQRPWQSYALALLQHHYKNRKQSIVKNYTQLLGIARKDSYIDQEQYNQLDAFIRAVANDPTLQAAIDWWLDILIGIDEGEQAVRPVKVGNETSSVLGRGKSKKTGRRR